MRRRVLTSLHRAVSNFTAGGSWRGHIGPSPTKGTVHYCQALQYLLFEIDLAFGSDIFTEAERARIRGQLAFLAQMVASPDYYDLGRDYRANPNMTTVRHTVVGMFGCLLRRHPEARAWYRLGGEEVDRELNSFMSADGGWIESPHYQTLLYSVILFLKAAQVEGFADDICDERLLKALLYSAKISTPRDRSFHGLRHLPAVGDTPRYELSMLPSMMAKAVRDCHPEVANDLQWIWCAYGRPLCVQIGGDCIVNHFPEFFVADFEPAHPPAWTSEMFATGGAVLRSGFPGDRETHMHLYAGAIWSHYSTDNGSFILYGKGEPLVLDWGLQRHQTRLVAQQIGL